MIDVKRLRWSAKFGGHFEVAAEVINELLDRLEAAERERDELQAYLVDLRDLCDYWIMAGKPGPDPSEAGYSKWRALGYQSRAWTNTPKTSLARQKLLWQAEALAKAMREVEREPDSVKKGLIVAAMIRQLRRQAKE